MGRSAGVESPLAATLGGGRLLNRIARGMFLAIRSGAAPIVLGARLAGVGPGNRTGIPTPRRSFALASKIALDEFFFATEIVSAPIVPLRDARRVVRELARSLDLFAERGWLDDPASYHREPPPLEIASIDERRSTLTRYRHLRYESGYEPHVGEPGRGRWLSYRSNRMAHAWLLRHPGPPRPWLVCIPGYRMGRPVVDFAGFRARWLYRDLGLNIAIPVLPLHGPRRIGRRDGDGFFTGDFVDTLHAQAQAVWEVRRLIGWLRSHGAHPPRVSPIVLIRPNYVLNGESEVHLVAVPPHVDVVEVMEQGGAAVPRHVLAGIDDVVPEQRRDRDERHVFDPEPCGKGGVVGDGSLVYLFRPVYEVHLVDRHEDMGNSQ